MNGASLGRRRFLAGTAACCAPALLPRLARAASVDLRVGAVLPLGGDTIPVAARNFAVVAEAARTGLVLSQEDLQRNAGLVGSSVTVLQANAPGAAAAARAARRLVRHDGATVLIGGFDRDDAEALSDVAEETGALFLNIGASSDALRDGCRSRTFHVEASAAMYLDAIAGWFVRAGHRTWHIVHGEGPEGEARLARTRAALEDRHWGARVAGTSAIRPQQRDFRGVLAEVEASAPDLVLLLTDWLGQLDFLSRYDAAGLPFPVTGFPEAATQTRQFYALARQSAPEAGTGHRAALWEATLDSYGARELNARYGGRWGRPMDPSAWAAYQALRIAFEAALRSGGCDGERLAGHLAGGDAVFDVHKGIGVSFRPWDHQLRQSLYLVRINPAGEAGHDLGHLEARAALVGELPAIYMPGTDPVERLDQLGDVRPGASCGP